MFGIEKISTNEERMALIISTFIFDYLYSIIAFNDALQQPLRLLLFAALSQMDDLEEHKLYII
ncbi:hypothetical protein DFR56_114102 [Pseudogracilibacillus auburnensis]|uniref:Uncharacterized protein n=1 Tax=Pseudogracilibacillus auburnensis TaxID=1494959 RepID=A0A2V3VPN9_9BACI|nr:hypothetical protein DFR56_114102 [Pseudogracilibacillus auburnensis]